MTSEMCDCVCVVLGEVEQLVDAMHLEHLSVFLDRARKSGFVVNICFARFCVVVRRHKDTPASVHKGTSLLSP